MRWPRTKTVLLAAAALLVTLACVELGRLTVSTSAASPAVRSSDYFDGLRVGEAQGRQEGRALQEGAALPPRARRPVAQAFDDGYAAGTNDAFAGYDGGWALAVPYIVTIEEGQGRIVYRIRDRTQMVANVDYHLCRGGHDVCSRRR
jgi:hypothetical protein